MKVVLAAAFAAGLMFGEEIPVLDAEQAARKAELEKIRETTVTEINGRIAELVEQAARAKLKTDKLKADDFALDIQRGVLVRKPKKEGEK